MNSSSTLLVLLVLAALLFFLLNQYQLYISVTAASEESVSSLYLALEDLERQIERSESDINSLPPAHGLEELIPEAKAILAGARVLKNEVSGSLDESLTNGLVSQLQAKLARARRQAQLARDLVLPNSSEE